MKNPLWAKLNECLSVVDLEDWLAQYDQIIDGGGDERRLKTCPSCGNDNFKLYVNVAKRRWICYVCDWGRGRADVTHLMARVAQRPKSSIHIELLQLVAPSKPGDITNEIEQAFAPPPEEEPEEPEGLQVPGVRATSDERCALDVRVYAYDTRGLRDVDLDTYGLRAAEVLKMTNKSGEEKLIRGPFLVWPVPFGREYVSYQGRRIFDAEPKYVSHPNIKKWLYPYNRHFFDHYRRGDDVYLVEGVFDVLGMHQLGCAAVLCTFGKSISDPQIDLLRRVEPGRVILGWDADAKKEINRAVKRLQPFTEVAILNFNDKTDPGDLLKNKDLFDKLSGIINNPIDTNTATYAQWLLEAMFA